MADAPVETFISVSVRSSAARDYLRADTAAILVLNAELSWNHLRKVTEPLISAFANEKLLTPPSESIRTSDIVVLWESTALFLCIFALRRNSPCSYTETVECYCVFFSVFWSYFSVFIALCFLGRASGGAAPSIPLLIPASYEQIRLLNVSLELLGTWILPSCWF